MVYAGALVDHTGTHAAQETPLHWACRSAHSEMVRTLLSLGADVNKRDAYGHTAVHHLCGADSSSEAVNLLHLLAAAGADLNEVDDEGQCPLHIAASAGNTELCWYLIRSGADSNSFDRQVTLTLTLTLTLTRTRTRL